ncbi:MAG: cupredoxin domain-containing protein [bacterium]
MKKTNNQNIIIIFAIVLAAIAIFFALNYSNKSSSASSKTDGNNINNNVGALAADGNTSNVSIDGGGKQIIEIRAKGGFNPVQSIAHAGIPTILRVDTNGTFDCSSTIRIPSLNITKNLPLSGTTDIDIGTQQAGIFRGTCGMGMYPFEIDFQS